MNEFDSQRMDVGLFLGYASDLDTNNVAKHKLSITGFFEVEIIRKNGEIVNLGRFNGVTNVGLNNMLGVTFHGDTQNTSWYIGLISNTSFSAVNAADTMSSHSGWTESAAYSNSTRPAWAPDAASSLSISNSTQVVFNINVDSTALAGAFITSNSTKSGTSGILWSTGLFGSVQTLNNGDQLKITYTINLTTS